MSEAFLQIAGVFSQLELAMICARVRSRVENARAMGKRIGSPQLAKTFPPRFCVIILRIRQGALNVSELTRICDLSRTTVYKYLGIVEESLV